VLAAEVARLEAVVRALGFSDDDTDPTMRHFGHGGGAPGMNGERQIYPQNG